jgi:dephospho-CoA kinase
MYLIGLTGNIATGKSTVCNILEQLGARVIDADVVAHGVLKRGTPAWRSVVNAFGYDILRDDGAVDRRKLGAVVFNDAAKLRTLERIIHPAVGTELALMLRDLLHAGDAAPEVVVIEAVKLYEAGLTEYLDALWVVTAPPEEQKRRLMQERGMSEVDAELRLRSQPPLEEKLERATVVIDNGGSIEETRVQVMRAFVTLDLEQASDKTALLTHWLGLDKAPRSAPPGRGAAAETPDAGNAQAAIPPTGQMGWTVRRARPGDARKLAELVARIEGKTEALGRAEMLERQGRLGYWLVLAGEQTIALAAWQAENLTAIVRELWVQDLDGAPRALPPLLRAIEDEANALACEVIVIVVPPRAADLARIAAQASGYEPTTVEQLHQVWRSVVEPMLTGQERLYAKHLLEIITEPI